MILEANMTDGKIGLDRAVKWIRTKEFLSM